MRTRFRGRLAWENMGEREGVCVVAWGMNFLSRPGRYFFCVSISACISVYSCSVCIFVHFSESPGEFQDRPGEEKVGEE